LLARSPHFAKGLYSALAGFVEAGESCEEAVHREVKEEVGIKVNNISYFGSQAWPFPNSLIMAFRAQYAEGDLQPDENEIEDAQWFKVSELQKYKKIFLPHGYSISRHIIDSYINRVKA